MNHNEQVAYEWLLRQGYRESDIIFTKGTPDFVCTDGKRYEAKELNAGGIDFYEGQKKSLVGSTIIVTTKGKVIRTFEWDRRANTPQKIRFLTSSKFKWIITLTENADKKLRRYVEERYGNKRGAISIVVEEAVRRFIQEETKRRMT